MIVGGYGRLTKKLNLKRKHGVAYGRIEGFMTTLFQNDGRLELFISLYVPSDHICSRISKKLGQWEIMEEHRILRSNVYYKSIQVSFRPGISVRQTQAFVNWFYPWIVGEGALRDHCPECGQPLSQSAAGWKLMGKRALALHPGCADRLAGYRLAKDTVRGERANWFNGLGGAVLGAALGALPWIFFSATELLTADIFLPWLGLLIGLGAGKGYGWMGGHPRRIAIPVLLAAIAVATVSGGVVSLALNELYEQFKSNLLRINLLQTLRAMQDVVLEGICRREFLLNTLATGLFALLGTFPYLRKIVESDIMQLRLIDLEQELQ